MKRSILIHLFFCIWSLIFLLRFAIAKQYISENDKKVIENSKIINTQKERRAVNQNLIEKDKKSQEKNFTISKWRINYANNLENTYSVDHFGEKPNLNLIMMKYSPQGQKDWMIKFTPEDDMIAIAEAIAMDNNGNFFVAKGEEGGFKIIKYNIKSEKEWETRYDMGFEPIPPPSIEYFLNPRNVANFTDDLYYTVRREWRRFTVPIIDTDDKGNIYIIAKNSDSYRTNEYLIKFNSLGTKEWITNIGENEIRNGTIFVDKNDIYIVCVNSVTKYNHNTGKMEWMMLLKLPEYPSSVVGMHYFSIDEEKNIYLLGEIDYWGFTCLITGKYNAFRNQEWLVTYGTFPPNCWYRPQKITIDNDKNIYIQYDSFKGFDRCQITAIKYDQLGNIKNVLTTHLPFGSSYFGGKMATDNEKNIYVCSFYPYRLIEYYYLWGSQKFYMVKYDTSLRKTWELFDNIIYDIAQVHEIIFDTENNCYIIAQVKSDWISEEYTTVASVTHKTNIEATKRTSSLKKIKVLPSIFVSNVTFQLPDELCGNTYLRIYDNSGRLIKSNLIESPQFTWEGKDESGKFIPTGIYFLNFICGMSQKIFKVIKIK